MNRRPRILLIGRHFWPHGSIDAAGFLFQLAHALHRHGAGVEVLTPRYASSWPEQLTIREIAVHRPAAAPRSDWSMGRYARHLTTWLRHRRGSYDVIMVDAIREEATVAIEASQAMGCPIILRSSGWGPNSDPLWWRTSRSARKCGVIGKMADAVIASSAVCQRALIADGYDASRIHRIDNGFAASRVPSAVSRQLARKALATANGDLATGEATPVVLCCSRMTRDSGANLLVKAAYPLIARYPDLRLWFIGDGPHRDWMYETLRGDGVRASIAMPGSFCDVEEIFAAADLFLQPDEDGLDFFLPAAISAELPIVAIDNGSTRAVIGSGSGPAQSGNDLGELVQWVSGATSKLVRIGIARALDDLPAHRSRAAQLRRRLLRSRPQSDSVKAHLALMEKLIRKAPTADRNSSVEAVS